MAQQIPKQYDPVALCRRTEGGAAAFTGTIALDSFDRLAEALSESADKAEVNLRFKALESGRPAANGSLKARLPLACQRCLQTVWTEIEQEFNCCFASSEAVAERMPDEMDVVMMDEKGKADLTALFEDELLLALPIFPKHEEGGCVGDIAKRLDNLTVSEDEVEEVNPTRKAFAGLGQLLDQNKQKTDDSH